VNVYRTSYRLSCCAGILFNHESPRRGERFVTRKITKYVAALHHHLDATNGATHRAANRFPMLKLGNTKSARDWSHAKDMVRAMWMMLQAETPRDYVVSSNESHTVEDFLDRAFRIIGQDWRNWVETDKDMLRPMEVPHLHGSSRRISQELGWKPEYTFDGLVQEMVAHDIEEFQRGADASGSPPRAPLLKTHQPAA
jgi:GDPmannose 4,6-dehydratase